MRVSVDDDAFRGLISSANPPSIAAVADDPSFTFLPVPRLTFVNHSGVSPRASENASRASQSIADDASEERLLNIEKQLRSFADADDADRLTDIERQLLVITETLAAMNVKLDVKLKVELDVLPMVRPKLSRHGTI